MAQPSDGRKHVSLSEADLQKSSIYVSRVATAGIDQREVGAPLAVNAEVNQGPQPQGGSPVEPTGGEGPMEIG